MRLRETRRHYVSLSSSVRYLGASAFTFSMNAAWSLSFSFGGGVVRVATGTPTSMKNFSCPDGEHMHSNRTGLEETLWNWCAALEGTFTVSPRPHRGLRPAERRFEFPFKQDKFRNHGDAAVGRRLEECACQ